MAAKKVVSNDENKCKAFVNWKLMQNDEVIYTGDKGFPLFQNPDYPSAGEDMLIALAEKQNGIELTMKVTVNLNQKGKNTDIETVMNYLGIK